MSIDSLNATLSVQMRWRVAESDALSTTADSEALTHTATKTLGTSDGNANLVWHGQYTTGQTLNPAALARNVFGVGGTFVFTKLKTVHIKNAGSANLTVTVPPCGISSAITIAPGGILVLDSPVGWDVGGGSIVTTGSTTAQIVIVGVGTVTP